MFYVTLILAISAFLAWSAFKAYQSRKGRPSAVSAPKPVNLRRLVDAYFRAKTPLPSPDTEFSEELRIAELRDNEPLPERYGQTRITALVKDPWWIYVFWEVVPGDRRALLDSLGVPEAQTVLRVYTGTDVVLEERADEPVGHRFLNVGLEDTEYTAHIGLLTADGSFHSMAVSNAVRTPRSRPSTVIDPDFPPLSVPLGQEPGWSSIDLFEEAKHD